MSRSAQYFQSKRAILLVSQERAASRPTRQPALLRRVLDIVRPRLRTASMARPGAAIVLTCGRRRRRCTVKIS